jgi:putative transposase
MMRGESLHRKIREQMVGGGISLETAHIVCAEWFDRYVRRPQQDGHLKGIMPLEVFEAGKGPGVDRSMLHDMMMAIELKSVQRSAIKFGGHQYYHPALHGHTHKVLIRYDFQDTSSIRVHDISGEFICEASRYELLHPAAKHLGDESDQKRLEDHCAEHRRQEREAMSVARQFLKEEFLPAHRKPMRSGCMPALPPVQEPEIAPMSDDEWRRAQEEAAGIEVVQETPGGQTLDADAILRKAETEAAEEDAFALRQRLEALDEPERYLAIKELEIRGRFVPSRWQDFVRYFENTLEYLNHVETYEEKTGMLAVQWQKQSEM